MPSSITYSTGKSATYIYDASGMKLRTSYKASSSATAQPTDYCGNMIYENNVLKQILIDGGYVTFNGSTPVYHYYLQDHQGNNRVVCNASGTVEQVNHYYPFGGLYGQSTNGDTQRFKYNGKELDRMHGLDLYDYGARHYDAAIGRFTTVDPLCEKYYHLSPYTYCANNPVNRVDPDGCDVHPADSAAYITILNTLHPADRQYVILDKNGNIDYAMMKAHDSDSENYKCLMDLAGSDIVFNVNIQENYTAYMNEQGASGDNGKLSYCEPDDFFVDNEFSSPSGLTTGESGKYGTTLLPGNGSSGVNSVDNAAHVFIHPSLSEIGKAEALSHELYGHGYLYHKYRDRSVAGHQYKGSTDTNILLRQHIFRARKETVSYFKK